MKRKLNGFIHCKGCKITYISGYTHCPNCGLENPMIKAERTKEKNEKSIGCNSAMATS